MLREILKWRLHRPLTQPCIMSPIIRTCFFVVFFLTCSLSILSLFHPFTFHMCPSWPAELVNNQQPSVSITFNKGSAFIPLFISPQLTAAGAMRWHRGNHNGPHVSMHIHAFPPHRLTATTLQRAIEEMLKSEWGMDEMGRGGGQKRNIWIWIVSPFSMFGLSHTVWNARLITRTVKRAWCFRNGKFHHFLYKIHNTIPESTAQSYQIQSSFGVKCWPHLWKDWIVISQGLMVRYSLYVTEGSIHLLPIYQPCLQRCSFSPIHPSISS